MTLGITVIVCAHNEERGNASTDETGTVASRFRTCVWSTSRARARARNFGLREETFDVWEAANREDLFSVTSLKHYPYVANSDFHKPKHLHSWKTLLRCDKTGPAIKRALRSNVDIALTLFRNGAWSES